MDFFSLNTEHGTPCRDIDISLTLRMQMTKTEGPIESIVEAFVEGMAEYAGVKK